MYFWPVARILAIDYGTKKSGLAVTDPLQIIVSGLETVPTAKLMEYLKTYLAAELVEKIVIGKSTHSDGSPNHLYTHALGFSRQLQKQFPELEIDWQDEFGTSKQAKEIMLKTGLPKKKRREKERVDRIAAVLILQEYLGHY